MKTLLTLSLLFVALVSPVLAQSPVKPPTLTAGSFGVTTAAQLQAIHEMEEVVRQSDPATYRLMKAAASECDGCVSTTSIKIEHEDATPTDYEEYEEFSGTPSSFEIKDGNGVVIAIVECTPWNIDGSCVEEQQGKPVGWVCIEDKECTSSVTMSITMKNGGADFDLETYTINGETENGNTTITPAWSTPESWIATEDHANGNSCDTDYTQVWKVYEAGTNNLRATVTLDALCKACSYEDV